MKSEDVVVVRRKGEIRIGKKATESLGISGWKWLVARIEGDCVFMRICKSSPMETGDHLIRLREKSSGLRGSCLKFAEKLNFGDSESLDFQFFIAKKSDESVLIKISIRLAAAEETTQDRTEEIDKEIKAEIVRWIRDHGCDDVSCDGVGRKFNGVICPLFRIDGSCRSKWLSYSKEWLIRNGYSVGQEINIGTISKPTEKQLDIFDLPRGKAGGAPRTRPLPDGLPEWLNGPLSRGEHVRVSIKGETNNGWAVGVTGSDIFPVIVASDGSTFWQVRAHRIDKLSPMPVSLKPAAECLAIAKALKIGLSPMQVDAISSGGVPPKGHGLPDEMFE